MSDRRGKFEIHPDGGSEPPETDRPVSLSTAAALMGGDQYAPAEVVDSRGRRLIVKRLRVLDRMRLADMVGTSSAQNPEYFGFAMLAATVTHIDDRALPKIANKNWLEARVAELDDEGLDAVAAHFAEEFEAAEKRALASGSGPIEPDEEHKARVKNS